MFGWKYLHFIDRERDVFVNVILHSGDMFGRNVNCYASLVASVGGQIINARQELSQNQFDLSDRHADVPCFRRSPNGAWSVGFDDGRVQFRADVQVRTPCVEVDGGVPKGAVNISGC